MLDTIDLTKTLDKKEYRQNLIQYQVALHDLGYQVYVQQRPVILVFEGWDAGGKGGAIKRVTERLDPRGYVVHAIADGAAKMRLMRCASSTSQNLSLVFAQTNVPIQL